MFQRPWGGIRAQSASYCQMNNKADEERAQDGCCICCKINLISKILNEPETEYFIQYFQNGESILQFYIFQDTRILLLTFHSKISIDIWKALS